VNSANCSSGHNSGEDHEWLASERNAGRAAGYGTAPLLLVAHLVLTRISGGLWIAVWVLLALRRRLQRRELEVVLLRDEDGVTVQVSGSASWGQATEAHVRRNLPSRKEGLRWVGTVW
jgi:hypothetical protein